MFKQVHQFKILVVRPRIYYDGDHSDFVDTTDRMSGEEGVFNMQLTHLDRFSVDPYAIGSNWAKK